MKLSLKNIANPYTIFSVAWVLCLILYSMGWADIFPHISTGLFVFVSVAIIIFFLTGILFNRFRTRLVSKQTFSEKNLNYKWLFIINAIIYSLNFIHGGIPLLKGVREDVFGIPTIIVIATTLNSFTCIYCFYIFLLTNRIRLLIYSLMCIGFFVLVFSRGNIMMTLLTSFFLWINVKAPVLNIKSFIIIISILLTAAFLFGVAGNFRTINGISQIDHSFNTEYNSNVILNIGGATESFRSSIIPGEFFWSYLYLTSPLSNLQYNINIRSPAFTLKGVFYLVVDEFLFDTVSKRIDKLFSRKRADSDLIVEELTVPTALDNSYTYAGWGGMALYLIVFWMFPAIYTILVSKNPMGIIGISVLCTVYFFSIFDNMLILTGLTFQILYPLFLNFVNRLTLKPNTQKVNNQLV